MYKHNDDDEERKFTNSTCENEWAVIKKNKFQWKNNLHKIWKRRQHFDISTRYNLNDLGRLMFDINSLSSS